MTSSTNPTNSRYDRLFRRLVVLTVATVYLLVAAGGIVRSTGAGMGCPDWPKCFGRWIPPTNVAQLPSDYKEVYGAKLKGEVEFNATKTWTEYVNRLLGAFTGVLIFAVLLYSTPYRRKGKSQIFYASLAAFLLVGFQGWLGSKVVSSELHPLLVTAHMVVAVLIVFVLLYVLSESFAGKWASVRANAAQAKYLRAAMMGLLGLTLAQIVLGTQVRESVDGVVSALGYEKRGQWIDALGAEFHIHRSFSLLVLAANGWLYYRIRGMSVGSGTLAVMASLLLGVLLAEIATGVIMAYFAIPAFAQPLHLTLALLLAGIQLVMYLSLSRARPEKAPHIEEVHVPIRV